MVARQGHGVTKKKRTETEEMRTIYKKTLI